MTDAAQDEIEAVWAAQEVTRGDFERVERFGDQHPETWTGIRWSTEVPGGFIGFSTAAEAHRAHLVPLMGHPEALEIRQAPYSRRRLDEVWAALRESVPQAAWFSMGPGSERVTIRLHGREGDLAARLHERFVDALEIRLGTFRYPPDPAERPRLRPAPRSTIALPHVAIEVHAAQEAFAVGERVTGTVRFLNRGAREVRFGTGRTSAHLLDARDRVISANLTAHTLVLRWVQIGGGCSTDRSFAAGIDCLDPALGAVVPAGEYRLVVTIHVRADEERSGDLVPDPVPIRIG